jgi:hypothetical protein
MALLAWFAFGVLITRRHRKRQVGIATLRQAVRNIILIRAAQLLAPPAARVSRNVAPASFRYWRRRASLRVITGVWLRRRLNTHGDFRAQVQHLLDALRNWRALAAELAVCRRRGLTRLVSIKLAPLIAAPIRAGWPPALPAADTS